MMKEDGKLLPYWLGLRHHGFLEQIVLDFLGQLAPDLRNSLS
jgi:hypothetical protein